MAEESGHLRVLRIKSEILPRYAPQDDRQNQVLRCAQDDTSGGFRTTHSILGILFFLSQLMKLFICGRPHIIQTKYFIRIFPCRGGFPFCGNYLLLYQFS